MYVWMQDTQGDSGPKIFGDFGAEDGRLSTSQVSMSSAEASSLDYQPRIFQIKYLFPHL